jgi:hypothetical protein
MVELEKVNQRKGRLEGYDAMERWNRSGQAVEEITNPGGLHNGNGMETERVK